MHVRLRAKRFSLVRNTEKGQRRYDMHGDSDGHHSSEDEFAALLEAELGEDDPGRDRPAETSQDGTWPTHASKRRRTSVVSEAGTVCPPHPGSMHGICIRCGESVLGATEDTVALKYIHKGLQISKAEAERIREQGLQRTLGERKLLLVLDLDHTLLNSTRFSEVSPERSAQLERILEREGGVPGQSLYRLEDMQMWTKLRPYVREFLAAARKLAEMHIYTHGDRDYAAAMAAILDPTRALFQDRVISQADSTQKGVKHLDVMLGAESAVVILDDTEAVWPNHRDNLIQVDRYIFFPADAQRFSAGPSLLERGQEESAECGQLSTARRVLEALQQRIFSSPDEDVEVGGRDVRRHLRQMKGVILKGLHLCFTKLIPLRLTKPERHLIWQMAEELGASCSLQLHERVTHLVAGGCQTDKAVQAAERGIPVVSPDWLYASAFLWKRADEELYKAKVDGEEAPVRDQFSELRAVLMAAGGGRGAAEADAQS